MSKYVKNLITEDLRHRLEGVEDALLVNVVGLDANANNRLRGELEAKHINVLVVKNSLARHATAGSPLAPMFEGLTGTAAICWGSEDVVSLAKEITQLAESDDYEAFQTRGGVMDGESLTPQRIDEISKWPGRAEQLSILSGQLLSPGRDLVSQILAPGGALVSQIEKKAEEATEQSDG